MPNSPKPNPSLLAIIGAACRFPGPAFSLAELYALLRAGKDAVTTLPPHRFALDRFFSESPNFPGHSYTKAAGVLPDIESFDPEFFGISRAEAKDLDPQQQMVLEMTWEAMESAGIPPSTLRGSPAGVYLGVAGTDAALRNTDDMVAGTPYSMTGSTLSIVSNRVSYLFDLHGPSLSIDTACSSALVALHIACEALRSGEVPLAVVGGINSLFSPYPFAGFSKAKMLSPDGRCKVFDAAGNGYVRSEGGGIVLITTLEQAQKSGCEILALIAGSGVNSDGRTTGISLPNPKAQASLIHQVYERFGLDRNKLAYVEAHGTGTAAGDPLEASAIGEELGRPLRGKRPLFVGSVKSNMGHLETASGMAGLFKAMLVLRHGEIPPNLHFNTPNPAIDFKACNINVPTKLAPMPDLGGAELVGINSFGFGGTNAHVVLQKPDGRKKQTGRRAVSHDKQNCEAHGREYDTPYPLLLSARSAPSLRELARRYAGVLENADAATCRQVACAAAQQREQLDLRAVAAGCTPDELRSRLLHIAEDENTGSVRLIREHLNTPGSGIFAFSGNGCQWPGMGRELLAKNPVFLESLQETDAVLGELQGWSILNVLRCPEQHEDAFVQTEKSQPLIFAMQVGIVRALAAQGVTPAAVLGHSVGEVAAAWCAGALSLEDAALVIYVRSKLQAPLHGTGSMAAANMSLETAREMLEPFHGKIEVAAVNTNSSLSLAGNTEALEILVSQCKKRRIAAKMLPIPYPFHTRFMDAVQEELGDALAGITPRQSKLPFFSTVTGGLAPSFCPDADYWRRNVHQPVLFAPAVKAAHEAGFRLFLEIGPSPVLRSYLRDTLREYPDSSFTAPTLSKSADEAAELDGVWKKAWQNGWQLNLKRLFPERAPITPLPGYPWNRENCRRTPSPECRGYLEASRIHPLLGWRMPLQTPVFENTVHPADFPWLKDHVAGSRTLYPAAAFLESMLAAARHLYPDQPVTLERTALFRPLAFTPDSAVALRTSVDREDGGLLLEARAFNSAEPWGAAARSRIIPSLCAAPQAEQLPERPESFGMEVDKKTVYAMAERSRLHYGPAFQGIARAWLNAEAPLPRVLAELEDPAESAAKGMHIPPTLMDSAFHTLFLMLHMQKSSSGQTYLPASFEQVTLFADGIPRYAVACLEKTSARSITASFSLTDTEGTVLLRLQGCRFRRAGWIEHEHTPPRPYTVDYLPVPHPETVRMPVALVPSRLLDEAHKALMAFDDAQRTGAVQPWMLLQFASLAAAFETLQELLPGHEEHADASCDELLQSGLPVLAQEPWFRRMTERLAQTAFISLAPDGRIHMLPQDKHRNAAVLWRTALAASPAQVVEMTLLAHVFAERRSLLNGEQDNILSSPMLRAYYSDSASLKPLAEAARRAVHAALESVAPGEELRIFQAGKGLEAFIASLNLPRSASCRYTAQAEDAAEAESGKQRFASSPFVNFVSGDDEVSEFRQDEYYHLIVINWSLHEAANIAEALESYRNMLMPGGILLLLEQTPCPFTDYVFGSRPNWWRASPRPDKPVSLLQPPAFWEQELHNAAFSEITLFGKEHDAAFLLTARKPLEEPHVIPAVNGLSQAQTADLPDAAARSATDAEEIWLLAGAPLHTEYGQAWSLLADALAEADKKVSLLPHTENTVENAFDATNPDHWEKALRAHPSGKTALNIVLLAGYDNRTNIETEKISEIQLRGTAAATALVQALERSGTTDATVFVIGGGASAGVFEEARPVPSQGALLGFTRVAAHELRGVVTRFVDLQADDPTRLIAALCRELIAPAEDREVVLTPARRFVPRLVEPSGTDNTAELHPTAKDKALKPHGQATLTFEQAGRLSNLFWKQSALPEPEAGFVRVRVHCVGLNFRDVMWAMGLLPDEALENGFSGAGLGMECSGVIDAVGSGVTDWREGDEVVCFGSSCFSSHIVTPSSAVAAKPANLSFSEAATVPVAFMTAWYALKRLARLERGESVLIHGAAGGVGLAAVQIAAHLGLEPYATAGAPEKHHFLQHLGLHRLYSSRSLEFAERIAHATNGKGLDCVLNSLAGEAAAAGIGLLRPFGRFIELGKRDFYADTPMRLRPFSNNLSYFGVDVDQLLIHCPDAATTMFNELMALFKERKLMPLPHTTYTAERVTDAFQAMQQSTHIGKLVVSLENATSLARGESTSLKRLNADHKGLYLISGGSSGLGLASARLLVKRGARHIALLSRNGITGEAEKAVLEGLREQGATVTELLLDVADPKAVDACFSHKLAGMPPLKGIIHAAAALDDGMISSLTPERIAPVLGAKALGAWNLHRATREQPLDFFMMFSSATTQFGNPGQAGYVAANCMLETLAAYRRSQGLPAQVIGWGPIGDTGMLTRNPKARQVLLQRLGIQAVSSHEAMAWLDNCLAADIPSSAYFGVDWNTSADLPLMASPRFALVRPRRSVTRSFEGSAVESVRKASPAEGRRLVGEILLHEIAHILHLPADKLKGEEPLAAQGMDSLMAVELALAVEQKFELTGYSLPLTDKTTAHELAKSIHTLVVGTADAANVEGAADSPQAAIIEHVTQKHGIHLSEAQHREALERLAPKTPDKDEK